ncbi:cyclodeaminase/cyclohydrolase family protein [Spiribacter halobius]|uniref:Formiminotransferase-cyclodeaminase n=1 Tax=Sediminicurvatus halobius TaxID=2182432 RepID=A0A2U2MW45_9GAMM|nr:cyclodeaminase/cyclohydrolase family protein [Spiribacter halobius]PWG61087.1 formiminotransferase-cyclodeaminase [Spiribacter halobius]UEX79684.1 cyclodeaminase/cyclohydrolase family protein [Spiribacter halobius]
MPRAQAVAPPREGYAAESAAGLLERLASRHAVPGGGAGAALAVASGAALAAMAARLAGARIPDSGLLVQRLDALRRHALGQIDADAEAVTAMLAGGPAARARICDTPLALAESGAEIAETAARLVREGNPRLAGDAHAALLLAEAGVRVARALLEDTLAARPADPRRARVGRLADRARVAVSAAQGSRGSG